MTDYKVKVATAEDVDQIIDLLKMMHDENGVFQYDEEKTHDIITNMINAGKGVVGVIGEGQIEAMIGLIIDQLWYGKDFHLNELFNFVHPDYRRSTRVKSLITFAKKCSDEMQIPLVIGVVANHRTEAKVKLYERHFPKAGSFFLYNEDYARVNGHG